MEFRWPRDYDVGPQWASLQICTMNELRADLRQIETVIRHHLKNDSEPPPGIFSSLRGIFPVDRRPDLISRNHGNVWTRLCRNPKLYDTQKYSFDRVFRIRPDSTEHFDPSLAIFASCTDLRKAYVSHCIDRFSSCIRFPHHDCSASVTRYQLQAKISYHWSRKAANHSMIDRCWVHVHRDGKCPLMPSETVTGYLMQHLVLVLQYILLEYKNTQYWYCVSLH